MLEQFSLLFTRIIARKSSLIIDHETEKYVKINESYPI